MFGFIVEPMIRKHWAKLKTNRMILNDRKSKEFESEQTGHDFLSAIYSVEIFEINRELKKNQRKLVFWRNLRDPRRW